ncbi:MAG: Gfo/Idh/MocA family oxidoreductase [Bacteroidaceae bacterium]|nr:Gfo/Idh/MocA family oxidoreductase [Bacteroidaceae bacterium]
MVIFGHTYIIRIIAKSIASMEKLRVGIIGAGWIAHKMAQALSPIAEAEVVAIASRSQQKATDFAAEYGIAKAYGSYEDLVGDSDVDLVYVATPHSHHYDHARLALDNGKPVLVEKAFTANERQARELIGMARERGLFITEAIWTRYMPLSHKVKELMESGVIGEPRVLTATLCYMMENKERIVRPDLCGGALLDLGVYVLNFARMYFGTDIVRTVSNCHIGPSGMDMMESISLSYADGRMANLQAGCLTLNDRQGIISGTEGYIRVDNVNCPEVVEVWRNYELVDTVKCSPNMVNGYEYQVLECKRCLEQGLLESPMMPHAETLAVMRQMDSLRREWGVRYPMD